MKGTVPDVSTGLVLLRTGANTLERPEAPDETNSWKKSSLARARSRRSRGSGCHQPR